MLTQAKIYKITCDEKDLCYIGSTCSNLNVRFMKHTNGYRCYRNGRAKYVSSYEIVKYPSAKIVLVESPVCDSKDDLLKRERFWINEFKETCVNMRIPGLLGHTPEDKKEYYKQKTVCECGTTVLKHLTKQHTRTAKHSKNMTMCDIEGLMAIEIS